jgi:TolA-binding protein
VTVPDPRVAELAARLDGMTARLEQIDRLAEQVDRVGQMAERLENIDARLTEIANRPAAGTGQDTAAVPTETMRLRAKALSTDASTRADAIEAWGAVAERAADTEQKAEALFEQGEGYRKLEDWKRAANSFRQVVETAGLRSERGQSDYANDDVEHYRKIAKAASDRLGELR